MALTRPSENIAINRKESSILIETSGCSGNELIGEESQALKNILSLLVFFLV